jgi:hypothetical protein
VKSTIQRLFVPLKSEAFDWFAAGTKCFELRRIRPQFDPRLVRPGRRVQLSKGYSGSSIWGKVGAVKTASTLDEMFEMVDYHLIIPNAESRQDAVAKASEYVGQHGPFIAFEVLLEPRWSGPRLGEERLNFE